MRMRLEDETACTIVGKNDEAETKRHRSLQDQGWRTRCEDVFMMQKKVGSEDLVTSFGCILLLLSFAFIEVV